MKYIPNTQFCENYDPHGYPFDILYFFNNIFVKCKKRKKNTNNFVKLKKKKKN